MAHLDSRSSRVVTIDINNDGNYSLLVIDDCIRLKVFRGMNLVSSHKLLDEASCMQVFYPSALNRQSSVPAVGVATMNNIYIYRNMRPYYKFTVPNLIINSTEQAIWQDWRTGSVPQSTDALQRLKELKEFLDTNGGDDTELNTATTDGKGTSSNSGNQNNGSNPNGKDTSDLTFRTMFILSMTDPNEQLRYIEAYKQIPLVSQTVITCLTAIKKESEEYNAVSQLILGTENSEIIFLDSTGANIELRVAIPSVPISMQVIGILNIDYRVIIATRSHNIFTIRNGKLLGNLIELESDIISMIAFNKLIIVACVNQTIYGYHIKGMKKQFSIYFGITSNVFSSNSNKDNNTNDTAGLMTNTSQTQITCLEHMNVNNNNFNNSNQNLFLIGLTNGEVHLYNYNNLVYILKCDPSPITSVTFGKYGREDNSLIILNKTGTLWVKMLSRRCNLDSYNSTSTTMGNVGMMNSNSDNNGTNSRYNKTSELQDRPLDIPKVTQLFLDQTNREKENSIQMHDTFQKQNVKFKLRVNKEYYNVLCHNSGPLNLSSGTKSKRSNNNGIGLNNEKNMVLNVQVKGLGPLFKLQIELKNTNYNANDSFEKENATTITQHLKIIQNINVIASFDHTCYQIANPVVNIPLLIPGLTYNYDMSVNCIQDNANAKPIRLSIIDQFCNHYPYLSAIVDMPIAQLPQN